jgi:voltage-gated potassium channel
VRFHGPRIRRALLGPALIVSVALVVLGAGAVASLETGTVRSFWQGLWWSISLVTTVGFIGEPPRTPAGVLVSVALMVCGFVLLALISAALASLFVRDEAEPAEAAERAVDREILDELRALHARVRSLEERLADRPAGNRDRTSAVSASEAVPDGPDRR